MLMNCKLCTLKTVFLSFTVLYIHVCTCLCVYIYYVQLGIYMCMQAHTILKCLISTSHNIIMLPNTNERREVQGMVGRSGAGRR